jgi:23S rRNA pseudouridine1911/1915/1917 synthase
LYNQNIKTLGYFLPYILKQFDVNKAIQVEDFLCEEVGLSLKLSNELLSKGKITDHKNKRLQKKQTLKSGFINVNIFQAITKGLMPLFQTEHFAIFDKPSGLLVHPVAISDEYTLLDEIKYHFGDKASLVHRIDKETSGLILVSKNKYADMILKEMFEDRKYIKIYKAIVEGEVEKNIEIITPITNDDGIINIKMKTSQQGKESTTIIKPISYNKQKNQTLVQAIPKTGRQHQIRVHLNSIGHKIVGDPVYGLNDTWVDKFLKKEVSIEERVQVSGDKRLLLHAYYLEFEYLDIKYKFISKQTFQ